MGFAESVAGRKNNQQSPNSAQAGHSNNQHQLLSSIKYF
jgi:hypothetical protein